MRRAKSRRLLSLHQIRNHAALRSERSWLTIEAHGLAATPAAQGRAVATEAHSAARFLEPALHEDGIAELPVERSTLRLRKPGEGGNAINAHRG